MLLSQKDSLKDATSDFGWPKLSDECDYLLPYETDL